MIAIEHWKKNGWDFSTAMATMAMATEKKQVVFGRATDGEPGMDFIGRFKGGDLVFFDPMDLML